jgi:hypothetical protein
LFWEATAFSLSRASRGQEVLIVRRADLPLIENIPCGKRLISAERKVYNTCLMDTGEHGTEFGAVGGCRKTRGLHTVFFLLVAFLAAYYFTHLRLELTRSSILELLVDGVAKKPFQYRALMPWTIDALHGILTRLNFPFELIVEKPRGLSWLLKGQVDKPIVHIALFLELIACFLLIITYRFYVSLFVRNRVLCSLFSLSIIVVLLFNYVLPRMLSISNAPIYRPIFYPSDIPAVLFFTLGLILIHKKKWVPYYLLFAVATLNRETTCFLTVVYFLTAFGKTRLKPVMLHVAFQLVIWVSIKTFLYVLYQDNPGYGLFEFSVGRNISSFAGFHFYPLFLTNLGGTWLFVLMFRRYLRDDFLRRSLIVAIPYVIGMFIVGNLFEIRIFGELIPVFLTAALLIASNMIRVGFNEPAGETRGQDR